MLSSHKINLSEKLMTQLLILLHIFDILDLPLLKFLKDKSEENEGRIQKVKKM